ncbi:hypothetical protein BJ742DRAFT_816696 [Cladochytrium replicatum]|nr:hypothetical protein BJ742DRAFT_816696 [Cladochytrium replicatum]
MVFPFDIIERNAVAEDIQGILNFRRWMGDMDKEARAGRASTFHTLQTIAKKNPNSACVVFGSRTFTYAELDAESNRTSRWLVSQGVKSKDTIAILFPNCPEFLLWWLGAMKIGALAAFINNSQRTTALAHSLRISRSKLIVFDHTLTDAIEEILPEIQEMGSALFVSPGASWSHALSNAPLPTFASVVDAEGVLKQFSDSDLPEEVTRRTTWQQECALVYTSGTSGLPKAATVTHGRVMLGGRVFGDTFEIRPVDRIYCALPLFHSSGAVCGFASALARQCAIIIAPKFSATRFFDECRKYDATVAQYIGELCRYLLATPPSPSDTNHSVRLMYGNGLRPDIWSSFVRRFQIREIGEFYGASEGAATTMYLYKSPLDRTGRVLGGGDGVGAIGRSGPLMSTLMKSKIIKVDPISGDPVRNKNGQLIECRPNETGELVRAVVANAPVVLFTGYHGNPEASAKKLLHDCFVKGDVYYRTGDLVRRDARQFLTFMDRVGDTFRWKGENVSTTEVAEVLSKYPGILEANVYGAAVPGHDGRAGMAAIVISKEFDMSGFARHAAAHLPKYAVPLFIRILPEIPKTTTFKQLKYDLREEGANPAVVKGDPLYILDAFADGRQVTANDPGTYREMTFADYQKLLAAVKPRL